MSKTLLVSCLIAVYIICTFVWWIPYGVEFNFNTVIEMTQKISNIEPPHIIREDMYEHFESYDGFEMTVDLLYVLSFPARLVWYLLKVLYAFVISMTGGRLLPI